MHAGAVVGAIISNTGGMNRGSSGAYWGQGLLPGLQPPSSPDSKTPVRSPRFSGSNPSTFLNTNGHGNAISAGALSATADVSISLDDLKRASKYEGSSRGSAGGEASMDVPYLRNLLMKLLEAIAGGKANERDALLPIVGMLVGASPEECDSLKQLFVSKMLW
jgi:hypothetical protein